MAEILIRRITCRLLLVVVSGVLCVAVSGCGEDSDSYHDYPTQSVQSDSIVMWPFKKKSAENLPSDNRGQWAVATGEIDGNPIAVRVNTGARSAPHHTLPYRVGVAMLLRNPNQLGLPTDDEASLLWKVEANVTNALSNATTSLMVLAISTGGMREYVYYISDADAANAALRTLLPRIDSHEVQFIIESDPEWLVYEEYAQN